MKHMALVAIVGLLTFAGLSQTVYAEITDYFPGVSVLVESDKDIYGPRGTFRIAVKIINAGPEFLSVPLPLTGVLAKVSPTNNVIVPDWGDIPFEFNVPLFSVNQFIPPHSTTVLLEGAWSPENTIPPGTIWDVPPMVIPVARGTYLVEVNLELQTSSGGATYALPVKAQKLIYVEDSDDGVDSKLDTIQQSVSDVNANVTSTQAAVDSVQRAVAGVKIAVTAGDQEIQGHLTKQDWTLNQISSQVNAVYSLVKRLVKPILTPIMDPIYVFPEPVIMSQQPRQVSPKT